jgi:hypothetical protein
VPNIIDSLFLELGVDTSKFSADQAKALAKIQQFESQAKRSAGHARDSIKTVGQAFQDLARESRIGASATQLENLAKKLKDLGQSAQVSGGLGAPFGAMAEGLGMLLSPAALGAAAVGLLAKETWDFNKNMTDANSTLARNAELADMSATNLWAMGQAAKTVGGNAEGVMSSIAQLQTTLAGASIGVGDATPQLIGMARLSRYGARYNKGGFGKGVDEESLFKAARAMYLQEGRAKTLALLTGYGLANPDQANLMMSSKGWAEYKDAQSKAAAMKTGGGFEAVIRKSLQSQTGLGEKDISQAIAAEQAYGGIQEPMQSVVGLLTGIFGILNATLGWIMKIANFIVPHVKEAIKPVIDADKGALKILSHAVHGVEDGANAVANLLGFKAPFSAEARMKSKMGVGKKLLMDGGLSEDQADDIIGNLAAESSMNPLAKNGDHVGIAQWSKKRAAPFEKMFGYPMGSSDVSADQQFRDQFAFLIQELHTTQRSTLHKMSLVHSLVEGTKEFMNLFERPGDNSLGRRISFAQMAAQIPALKFAFDSLALPPRGHSSVNHNDNRSDVRIGDVHVHTPSADPNAHAAAVRNGIVNQPLLNFTDMATISLATRGMSN